MKKGTVSKNNAKQVQDSSFVCGVLDQKTGNLIGKSLIEIEF